MPQQPPTLRSRPAQGKKPRPADFHVAVDVVLFSLRNDLLHIGVVQRRGDDALIDLNHLARRSNPRSPRNVVEVPRDPEHHWALPGGHVGNTLLGDAYGTGSTPDDTLAQAALRVLARETSLDLSEDDLYQVAAFGDRDRDPRSGRTISVAYLAVIGDDRDLNHHPDGSVGHVSRVQFRPVVDVLARPNRLEFDHEDIVMAAIRLLRNLVVTTPLATKFCREEFTVGELRRVYEVLFHESLDSAEQAERREHSGVVRDYLAKLERMDAKAAPEFERAVSELALLLPSALREQSDEESREPHAARSRQRPDLVGDGWTAEIKLNRASSRRLSSGASSEGLASRGGTSGRSATSDLGRQAELMERVLRHGSLLRPPRPPRLIKPLDPTNFARKIQKLGILEPVAGSLRPTFERYGKPAALFRLSQDREDKPFLLRLDRLGRSDSSDSSD
jgi:ADP-ribose pyrophosphatase YjhB (NUDIX family)